MMPFSRRSYSRAGLSNNEVIDVGLGASGSMNGVAFSITALPIPILIQLMTMTLAHICQLCHENTRNAYSTIKENRRRRRQHAAALIGGYYARVTRRRCHFCRRDFKSIYGDGKHRGDA